MMPERPHGPHGRLLVDGVPCEPGQGAELDQEGADARRAGDGRLAVGHAVPQVDRAVRHPRGRVEGRQQPLGSVLRQPEERAGAGPAGRERGHPGPAGQQVGRQQPAHDADVGLEHRHVDVAVEILPDFLYRSTTG